MSMSRMDQLGYVGSVEGGPVCLGWPSWAMLVQFRVAQLGYVNSV